LKQTDASLTVAIAGNPNSGKTTIFNNLTGANQHVGNYPGVTVEKKEGWLDLDGRRLKLVDLPGTYSLSAHSIEEVVARNYIIEQKPDVVIDVVDASNIERNLYLTTQLLELDVPVVLALNMSDQAEKRGIITDHKLLSQLLGVASVPTVGNKKKGMQELLKAAIAVADNQDVYQPFTVNYGKEFEQELETLTQLVEQDNSVIGNCPPRWVALKLLEDDPEVIKKVGQQKTAAAIFAAADESRERLEALLGEAPSAVISDRRYGFISGACSEAVQFSGEKRHSVSDTIDLMLIHPSLGLPIFAFLMWMMFTLTFTLGKMPMEWIEWGVGVLAGFARSVLPEGLLSSLIVDGIIAGVGGVIVFLPNIVLLFLAIAILEDTGYMARAAFVMDRIMHRIGLHGKSFIPMLIGFGCTVPAYMGARIIEDRSDRLVTMHATGFMSCGARLPVYILVCGAFWPENAGNVVFSIYALGVLVAVGTIKLLRGTRFRGMSEPFIMELPPYRVPTVRSLVIHMWERSWMYIRKAGTIILAFSIIMWVLMTFPRLDSYSQDYHVLIDDATASYEVGNMSDTELDSLVTGYESAMAAESIRNSLMGRFGMLIEPAIEPLGFDWRMGVALISGFAAKEVVVSTMGTVYGVGEVDEESGSLRGRLAGDPLYSPLIAYAFLVFVLLYIPCMAAMAVFLRETGSFKELAFQIGYTTGLAWVMAFVVYQGGRLLGLD